jgi:hypothetical protein
MVAVDGAHERNTGGGMGQGERRDKLADPPNIEVISNFEL